MTQQETDLELPVSVQESLAEVRVGGGPAGSGALSLAGQAQDPWKEATIIFMTSTGVWPRVKQQEGNTAPPINRKLD